LGGRDRQLEQHDGLTTTRGQPHAYNEAGFRSGKTGGYAMKSLSLVTCLVIAPLLIGSASAQTISISATPAGSFTNSAASAMAKLIDQKTKLHALIQAQARQGHGPVHDGTADCGVSNSFDLTFFLTGTGEYKKDGPRTKIRVIGSLIPFRVAMHVRKDSDIKSLKDIKGKRVSSGFNAQKTIGRIISAHLANAGLTYKDVIGVKTPNVRSSASDFIAGKVDTLFFAVGSGAVKQAAAKVGGLRILPVDTSPAALARTQEFLPGAYLLEVKPARNIEGLSKPTKLVAFDMVFFCSPNVSDDVAYQITKAVHEGKADLKKTFRPFALFNPSKMAKSVKAAKFHPGAIKYYKEIGMMPKS
jgi:TRAP transporter TAXI family solute receptor